MLNSISKVAVGLSSVAVLGSSLMGGAGFAAGGADTAAGTVINDNSVAVGRMYSAAPVRVSGLAWQDKDGDGKRDRGEKTIGSRIVRVYDAKGKKVKVLKSDKNGSYATYLAPGKYKLVPSLARGELALADGQWVTVGAKRSYLNAPISPAVKAGALRTVTPGAPTIVDNSGWVKDSVKSPSTVGVVYRLSYTKSTGAWKQTATPRAGFIFPGGLKSDVKSGRLSIALPGLKVAKPVPPIIVDKDGWANDSVRVPSTVGVKYRLTYSPRTGAWTMTATPLAGYKFEDNKAVIVMSGKLDVTTKPAETPVTPSEPTTPTVPTTPTQPPAPAPTTPSEPTTPTVPTTPTQPPAPAPTTPSEPTTPTVPTTPTTPPVEEAPAPPVVKVDPVPAPAAGEEKKDTADTVSAPVLTVSSLGYFVDGKKVTTCNELVASGWRPDHLPKVNAQNVKYPVSCASGSEMGSGVGGYTVIYGAPGFSLLTGSEKIVLNEGLPMGNIVDVFNHEAWHAKQTTWTWDDQAAFLKLLKKTSFTESDPGTTGWQEYVTVPAERWAWSATACGKTYGYGSSGSKYENLIPGGCAVTNQWKLK